LLTGSQYLNEILHQIPLLFSEHQIGFKEFTKGSVFLVFQVQHAGDHKEMGVPSGYHLLLQLPTMNSPGSQTVLIQGTNSKMARVKKSNHIATLLKCIIKKTSRQGIFDG
jgi:hypothetical protein